MVAALNGRRNRLPHLVGSVEGWVIGRGQDWGGTVGLELLQLLQGLVVGAIYRALVTDQEGETVAHVAQFFKDEGQAAVVVHAGELLVDLLLAAGHFLVEQVGFDGEQTAETPTGDGQDLDQVGFDAGLGLELVHEVG